MLTYTLEDSQLTQLVAPHTQHVHTQEEARAPVVEACNPSTGMLVIGSTIDPSGCFAADAFVFSPAVPSESLIVDCAVRSGSVVSGTALSDSWGNRAEVRSFSEPEAGLFAPVVEGPAASLVCDPGRPEISDVGNPRLGTATSVAVPDGSPPVNVFDGFEAGFEAEFESCEKLIEKPGRAEISDVGNLRLGTAVSIAVPDGSPPVNVFDGFEAGFEAEFESCGKLIEKLGDGAESEVGMLWDQFPRCPGRRGPPNGPPVPVLPLWLPALLPFRQSPPRPSLTDGRLPESQTESSTVLPSRSGSSSLIMNFQTDGSLHCTVKVALPGVISSPNRRRSVVDALPASGAQAGCESRTKNSFLERGY